MVKVDSFDKPEECQTMYKNTFAFVSPIDNYDPYSMKFVKPINVPLQQLEHGSKP